MSVYLQVYLRYSSFSSSINQTYYVFETCVCVTLIQWPPDIDWIWTGPGNDVGRSSSCRPAL